MEDWPSSLIYRLSELPVMVVRWSKMMRFEDGLSGGRNEWEGKMESKDMETVDGVRLRVQIMLRMHFECSTR